jgi:hypothetical protein
VTIRWAGDPRRRRRRVWPEPPGDDALVGVRVAWLERCAALFDETAINGGGYGMSQSAAVRASEYLRRSAKELAEWPGSTGQVPR